MMLTKNDIAAINAVLRDAQLELGCVSINRVQLGFSEGAGSAYPSGRGSGVGFPGGRGGSYGNLYGAGSGAGSAIFHYGLGDNGRASVPDADFA